ncbi:MAG: hypothetical protein JRI79_15365 [Deltaproteobacteria bacterium]|nr:hypothetical protein [Deltaproteobacteria bacterium]MBW1979323.1 hypothetical protein [Deltaproteobacteria bacterium]MBW2045973.1 hypothetical protein [Deltaproteobacteria bacterium]MBW2301965.1 hypothetical protein [Deltaproteobacteria bacterium]
MRQQGCQGSAGVKEQGMQALGSPRNLGGPVISAMESIAMGSPEIKPRLIVGCVCSTMRAKQTGTEAVSEGEGNEA